MEDVQELVTPLHFFLGGRGIANSESTQITLTWIEANSDYVSYVRMATNTQ
jgi:hypothetical protein